MLLHKISNVGFNSIVMGKWQKKHRNNLLKLGSSLLIRCMGIPWVCEKTCPCSYIHTLPPQSNDPIIEVAFLALTVVLERCSCWDIAPAGQGYFWRALARQGSPAAQCDVPALHHGGSLSHLCGGVSSLLVIVWLVWFVLLRTVYRHELSGNYFSF